MSNPKKNRGILPQKYILFISSLFLVTVISGTIITNTYRKTTANNSISATEAFSAITAAFEEIEKASEKNIEVDDLVAELNIAINYYENGNYQSAYDKANNVKEEAETMIQNYRKGTIIPYFIIPLNLVLITAFVYFFGKDIINWYKNQRKEEFLDLEIVYNNKLKRDSSQQNNEALRKETGEE
jgi:hypothetical protein